MNFLSEIDYFILSDIDIFMHCALYVFYEANKDDYYFIIIHRSCHTKHIEIQIIKVRWMTKEI